MSSEGTKLCRRPSKKEDGTDQPPDPLTSWASSTSRTSISGSPASIPGASAKRFSAESASPGSSPNSSFLSSIGNSPHVINARKAPRYSPEVALDNNIMFRKRRLSTDLHSGSPPFSPSSPSDSSLMLNHSGSSTGSSHSRKSSLSSSTSSDNHHNPILDLFHAQPRSPSLGPMTPHQQYAASSPVGANSSISPHALLRQAQLASLAPPELSLPPGMDMSDIDAHWPTEPVQRGSPRSSPNASPREALLGSPSGLLGLSPSPMTGSPPLSPLFPASPNAPHPMHAHLLNNDSLRLTRFSHHARAKSFDESSESGDENMASPRHASASLPPPLLSRSYESTDSGSSMEQGLRGRLPRRRKRLTRSRGSQGSIKSDSSSRSSSLERRSVHEDSPFDDDQDGTERASPPLAPRTKHPHLALPERSGWEYPDDDEAEDDDSDGSNVDELEDEEEERFRDSARPSATRALPISTMPHNARLLGEAMDIDMDLASTNADLSAATPTLGLDSHVGTGPELPEHRFFDANYDASSSFGNNNATLSVLERIFILSKSEVREHRMAVAKALPVWLEDVDICEAVEYILPLLSGLASDDDDVKIVLAQRLDRIMYFYYSKCPLADFSDSDESSVVSKEESSSITELAQPMEMDEADPEDEEGDEQAAGSGTVKVIDPPRIAVGAFTPILGLLLMEQHVDVASWARASVVRFLCRLNNKPIPEDLMDEDAVDTFSDLDHGHGNTQSSTHVHTTYTMTPEARAALEQQILVDVVLGLARLENEEDMGEREDSMDRTEAESSTRSDSLGRRSTPSKSDPSSPGAVDMQQQSNAGTEEEQDDASASPDWGMPLRSYVTTTDSSFSASTPAATGQYFSNSVFELDSEATQGKIASIELISAIAAAECLPAHTVAEVFVPEIAKVASDKAYRVRSVAASAIGPIAKSLPPDSVESLLLPLSDMFCQDSQPIVRRWACLTLPDIFTRLHPPVRRKKAIAAAHLFSQDLSRDVRSALTEISGPLIHQFMNEDIPTELLNWFLGKPLGSTSNASDADTTLLTKPSAVPQTQRKFSPLATALSRAHSSKQSEHVPAPLPQMTDPERAMICAYNIPAVCLTLGQDRWHMLRDFYRLLVQDKQTALRRSLAASLHVIAGIIGPEQTLADLVSVFDTFLHDVTEVRELVLSHYVDFVRLLPSSKGSTTLSPDTTRSARLRAVRSALYGDTRPQLSWRVREQVALDLNSFVPDVLEDGFKLDHAMVELLHDFMHDETAAVRNAGIAIIPALYRSISEDQATLFKCAFLDTFGTSPSYRHRSSYLATVSQLVSTNAITRSMFETLFLPTLPAFATDPVLNVRLALAGVMRHLLESSAFYGSATSYPPALLEAHQTLRQDADGIVRESLGADLANGSSQEQQEGHNRLVVDSRNTLPEHSPSLESSSDGSGSLASLSSEDSYEDDVDDFMVDSFLSSSTITDLRSLKSSDAEQIILEEFESSSVSTSAEQQPVTTQSDDDFVRID